MKLTFPDGPPLGLDRPRIMGILNLTPDSFSDGGRWIDQQAAVAHGLAMAQQGADIIDVGGESTRPGSQRVGVDEQIRRTARVIEQLYQAIQQAGLPARISIDTTLAPVARAALDAGASILNDVSAGREDAGMFPLAASRGVPIVLMHMKGQPATMQQSPRYDDVAAEVHAFLLARAQAAQQAGVPRGQVVLDPGIGFGKTSQHNLTLLAHLQDLVATGYPVLLGASRKRFMGAICTPKAVSGTAGRRENGGGGEAPKPAELIGATCATTALGVAVGVSLFRVHDVSANRQAADVAAAIRSQAIAK